MPKRLFPPALGAIASSPVQVIARWGHVQLMLRTVPVVLSETCDGLAGAVRCGRHHGSQAARRSRDRPHPFGEDVGPRDQEPGSYAPAQVGCCAGGSRLWPPGFSRKPSEGDDATFTTDPLT